MEVKELLEAWDGDILIRRPMDAGQPFDQSVDDSCLRFCFLFRKQIRLDSTESVWPPYC